ncbi:glutamine-dependent NAD(+) synthetase [Paraphoma chrysanthemicola]|nr:glutamine-dependent NAD(+) synthetase [Paraphoma chrysanthemicola]
MRRSITVAACSLNQWALDWEGNLARIKQSIIEAKSQGASLRAGSELEICGYGCLDHFLEEDTFPHSWDMLLKILNDDSCYDILLDIGMPIEHKHCRYNCRVLAFNGRILLIRPKMKLAHDSVSNEQRYFTAWDPRTQIDDFKPPCTNAERFGNGIVPFGNAVLQSVGLLIGVYFHDELGMKPHPTVTMARDGASLHIVSAASHHILGGLHSRFSELQSIAKKSSGILLYSNQHGCDGNRLYYDGCSMVFSNGNLISQGPQFSIKDVEVTTAALDLDEAEASRASQHHTVSFFGQKLFRHVLLDHDLGMNHLDDSYLSLTRSRTFQSHQPEEEIAMGPACWLWDYLRRSKASGVLVPLSDGIGSCATALIVLSMCRTVLVAIQGGNKQVETDVQTIVRRPEWLPKTPHELCNHILHTMFMGVSGHSSQATRDRAQDLACHIGAYHRDVNIDSIFEAEKHLSRQYLNHLPDLGSNLPMDDLALQNIQARLRMVTAYYFARLIPHVRGRSHGFGLLVLSSVNVEECLRGNLTKHDCSSADMSLTGSFTKQDRHHQVYDFIAATRTAELEPLRSGQCAEKAMGFQQQDLRHFAEMRKDLRLGPFSMFKNLLEQSQDERSAKQKAVLVQSLQHYYQVNRHKMSTIAPAYHGGTLNPDDHLGDNRPMLYPQFAGSWSDQLIEEAANDNCNYK